MKEEIEHILLSQFGKLTITYDESEFSGGEKLYSIQAGDNDLKVHGHKLESTGYVNFEDALIALVEEIITIYKFAYELKKEVKK